MKRLIALAVLLMYLCGCAATDSPNATHTSTGSAGKASVSTMVAPPLMVKGIVDSIDRTTGELTVSLSDFGEGAEGTVTRVQLRDRTLIQSEHDAHTTTVEQTYSLSDVQTGMPVTVIGRPDEEGMVYANALYLAPACKPEYCSRKNCLRKCGAKVCLCPKKS